MSGQNASTQNDGGLDESFHIVKAESFATNASGVSAGSDFEVLTASKHGLNDSVVWENTAKDTASQNPETFIKGLESTGGDPLDMVWYGWMSARHKGEEWTKGDEMQLKYDILTDKAVAEGGIAKENATEADDGEYTSAKAMERYTKNKQRLLGTAGTSK